MPSAAEQRDDRMWELARASGISRRRYLKLLAVGGAAGVLAACSGQRLPRSGDGASATGTPITAAAGDGAAGPGYFKDPAPFIERGTAGLEARLENMPGVTTPNRLFFVRNNYRSLDLDADSWRLSVEGDAAGEPVELSYADIRAMPSTTLTAYLECAGNHRAMFGLVNGREASGTQWERGAVSNGEWIGVSLGSVLERAGVDAARAPQRAAGRPRLRVPPKAASGGRCPSTKRWTPTPCWPGASTASGCLPTMASRCGPWCRGGWAARGSSGWAASSCRQSRCGPATTPRRTCSSATTTRPRAEPTARRSPSSRSRARWRCPGRLACLPAHSWSTASRSPPIPSPRWSGAPTRAPPGPRPELQSTPARYSWTRFEFAWSPSPGEYTVMTRATDATGSTQPDEVPFNEKGYLFNQPLPHPVTVA